MQGRFCLLGCIRRLNNKQKILYMKINHLIAAIVAAGLITWNTTSHAAEPGTVPAKAKLTEAEAGKIALKKVPHGKLGEGELEMENGILVYSFDIKLSDSKSIVEVQVNAVTGAIVDVAVEGPAEQAKEAAEDAKDKAKEGKEKDDDEKDEKEKK